MSDLSIEIFEKIGLEPGLISEIHSLGRLKKSSKGKPVITPDNKTEEIPFVLSGLLSVMRVNPDGQEVFLYYLEPSETCAMSITCCIEGTQGNFSVYAEEDSQLWMVPMSHMDSWIVKYSSFRRFVFNAYQLRFEELLHGIDSLVFNHLDERLFKYLLDTKQATGSFKINKTHEEIAKSLGTSRVVISRLLKKLEKAEKIEQHRNCIEIL